MRALQWVLVAVPLGLLYYEPLRSLVDQWSQDPNYSHGFLVPLVSVYYLWDRKEELRQTPNTGAYPLGILVLVGSLGLYVLGRMGDEMFTVRLSLLGVLSGIALVLGGREWFGKLRFPIFYLFFMIPLPYFLYNEIAVPLKLFAARVSTAALHAMGYTLLREGNVLNLPGLTLEVADACSGMRSLISVLALAGAIGWFFHKKGTHRVLLLALGVPIAIGVNVVRIVVTGVLAHLFGPEMAQGFFHEFAGLVIFGVALALLFATSFILGRWERKVTP
ncbi:exosortase [Desulfacinum hydrothermale DSM 13146]|uniref:Exosortase n=1 Tax=Desulfacinum hydrothermale DSM 13146 TaxID=1121390 RepID=A0A1W1XQT6_9BACT|nr:exosortase/archaeosortase family protein [Desulfacinum hydrothermale]SMC26266.1 exosortase [Desulfacinum hydrothermale DSM 13146]